jgi:hypothetical protein
MHTLKFVRFRARSWSREAPYVALRISSIALFILLFANAARAGNLFDDDFVPPLRSAPAARPRADLTPQAAPSSRPITDAAQASAIQPANSSSPAGSPPAAKPPLKVRVPEKTDQARSRKLLKEALADQLKDRSVAGRRKLAKTLLDDAAKARGIPADYFVLLTNAIICAEDGASLRLCFDAIDQLSRAYDVDALGLRADAVMNVWATQPTAVVSITNVQLSLDVLDQLLAEDDFATAEKAASSLQRAVSVISDADLKTTLVSQIREFTAIDAARQQAASSFEKLKRFPDDPAANAAVGGYYCLTRGQWARGLPYLAKGADPQLKALAIAELHRPADEAAAANLADGWWDAADKTPAPARISVLQHAAALYQAGMANLSGVRRLAVEKRIADVPSPGPHRRIDLLELFDPNDVVDGKWHVENGAVIGDAKSGEAHVEFRYTPPQEYDFRTAFVVDPGNDTYVAQICAGGHRQFIWFTGGWVNTISGFGLISNTDTDNPTSKHQKQWLVPGRRYRSVVKVRRSGVEAWLDDQLVTSWKTDYTDINLEENMRLRHDNTVGIGAHRDLVKWDLAELVEVTGQGTSVK